MRHANDVMSRFDVLDDIKGFFAIVFSRFSNPLSVFGGKSSNEYVFS